MHSGSWFAPRAFIQQVLERVKHTRVRRLPSQRKARVRSDAAGRKGRGPGAWRRFRIETQRLRLGTEVLPEDM